MLAIHIRWRGLRALPSSIFTQRHQELIAFITSVRRRPHHSGRVRRAAGKTQSFVSKVERGERRLDVIEFCQVAEALGHDPAKLLREFADLRGR